MGLAWQPEGADQVRVPQFGQVSTYRQRLSMRKLRCQVCGDKIDQSAPIRWMIPAAELTAIADAGHIARFSDDGVVTQTPPTCPDCIEVAKSLCPHLREEDFKIYRVTDVRLWGVFGEMVMPQRDTQGRWAYVRQNGVIYPYGGNAHLATGVLAKQQMVEFVQWEEET